MQEKEKFKIVSSKRTRYILPNILTITGVCLGISSIKFSLDQNFSLSVIFVLFASLLDALDGRIARLIKGTSEFGKELTHLLILPVWNSSCFYCFSMGFKQLRKNWVGDNLNFFCLLRSKISKI